MKPEKQQIAIAEFGGIDCSPMKVCICGDYLDGHHGEHRPVPVMDITLLPDYLNDRNSMCDALTKLTKAQQCEFGEWLVKDLGSEGDDCEVWDILALAFFQCVTAPLDNIARALLRTIGKWEESE